MKELKLTLHKKAFEVMVTGEKPDEFREDKPWIRSRLLTPNGDHKYYDTVRYTNGYGADRPYFITEYNGFIFDTFIHERYSNGLEVDMKYGIRIKNGKIIERGNLPTPVLPTDTDIIDLHKIE